MIFSPEQSFAQWYMANRPHLNTNSKLCNFNENYVESLLYRGGRFQAEMCTIKPNTKLVMHKHPGIDSVFLFGGGDMEFKINDGSMLKLIQGDIGSVTGEDYHGGIIGKDGAIFYTFQYWKGYSDVNGLVSAKWEYLDDSDTAHTVAI